MLKLLVTWTRPGWTSVVPFVGHFILFFFLGAKCHPGQDLESCCFIVIGYAFKSELCKLKDTPARIRFSKPGGKSPVFWNHWAWRPLRLTGGRVVYEWPTLNVDILFLHHHWQSNIANKSYYLFLSFLTCYFCTYDFRKMLFPNFGYKMKISSTTPATMLYFLFPHKGSCFIMEFTT